jgi:hypothetical protein
MASELEFLKLAELLFCMATDRIFIEAVGSALSLLPSS